MTENDVSALRLSDFRPRPMLRQKRHEVARAAVRCIDIHSHLGRWLTEGWAATDVETMIHVMDDCNVDTIINLDGNTRELDANIERLDRAAPGRFLTFFQPDWSTCGEPGWADRVARSITWAAARGAAGIKIWKDLGLRVRDEDGKLISPDDTRLAPMWEAIAEAGLPVLIHTADLAAFFEPLDGTNERIDMLLAHPDWRFADEQFPRLESLLNALEVVIAGNPSITFIGAHVGCYSEDLAWVSRMLDDHPNFNVDIAARIDELGRQPRATIRLIRRHPTRVLFGTDGIPPTAAQYRTYFRFLETEDEYFSTSDHDTGARWCISGLGLSGDILAAVYRDNAMRLVPALRT